MAKGPILVHNLPQLIGQAGGSFPAAAGHFAAV